MSKQQVIELMEVALKEATRVYNKVGEGELDFSEVGDSYHTYLGNEIITALQKGLVYLKGGDKE
jgi:hypothetical protein